MIGAIKDSFQKFFKNWLAFSYFQDEIQKEKYFILRLTKENQSLIGRIRLLEEQQEIMHNFLVEINKYLVNFSEANKMGNMAMGKKEGKEKKEPKKEGMMKKDSKKDAMKKGCKY